MPRDPRYAPLYAAFQAFAQRCLAGDRSLLWPDQEIWTIPNLEQLRLRFVEGYLQGRMTFREKLETQLSGIEGEVWALVADCFFVYGLPSSTIRYETKKEWVAWAAGHSGRALPAEDDPLWQALRTGFAGTGQKYNLKHAQLRLLILLALEIKGRNGQSWIDDRLMAEAKLPVSSEMQSLLDGILESIPLRLDRANDMRSAILYLLYPDEYEPVLSIRDKDSILRHYAPGLGKSLPADRDAALRQVREAITPRFSDPPRPFDFYQDLREEWRAPGIALERLLAEGMRSERDLRDREVPLLGETPGSQHILRERLERRWREQAGEGADPDVRRVLAALRLTKNVVLSGPPGTGKTYLARRVAERLAGAQGDPPESAILWVTLHGSYAYEDFVEGLRPVLQEQTPNGEGTIAYEVRPGVFREACALAAQHPSRPFVLVLDEINRANLARILGELITLIEDDKRGWLTARLPYSGLSFSVPPNLFLLGTMNSADRSVALLDAALRRRFAFVEIPPRPDLLAGVAVETEEAAVRLDALLTCLNTAVGETLGSDHLIGHSYFLRVAAAPEDERLALLELVWNFQVLPLLLEYFYNRRDRLAQLLAPFLEEGEEDLTRAGRLAGDDLVVALSRMCEG